MNTIKGRLLYLIGKNKGLVYDRLSFYLVNLEDSSKELVTSLPIGGWKRLLSRFRVFSRLLRLEPRSAIRFADNKYLISVLHKIWLLDTQKKELRAIHESRKGFTDCLNFFEYNSEVYWGDYGENVPHEPINIYKMDVEGKVDIVYTFAGGEVIHCHNIFLDENKSHFWLLMGDNEPHAGIYKASLDWKEVTPIKMGKQCYRTVVGFPCKGGLLYATDSVDFENHLRLIEADGTERVLAEINGSCIYGGETNDYFLFSTTVEPRAGSGFWHKFENRLGGGINSWDVHLIAVSKTDLSIKILKKYHKDWLPMVLFQYGRVRFAGGQEQNEDGFWCSPVACKGVDGKSVWLTVK